MSRSYKKPIDRNVGRKLKTPIYSRKRKTKPNLKKMNNIDEDVFDDEFDDEFEDEEFEEDEE